MKNKRDLVTRAELEKKLIELEQRIIRMIEAQAVAKS